MMMFCVAPLPAVYKNWIRLRYKHYILLLLSLLALALLTHPLLFCVYEERKSIVQHTHTWFFFHHMSRQAHKTLFLLLLLQLPRFSFFIIMFFGSTHTNTLWRLVHLKSNNDSVYFILFFFSFLSSLWYSCQYLYLKIWVKLEPSLNILECTFEPFNS